MPGNLEETHSKIEETSKDDNEEKEPSNHTKIVNIMKEDDS